MADDAVVTRAKDDVHTLPPQIGSLVESFSLFCATGKTNTGDHLEQRALRRRAAARELEARKLVCPLGPEPVHPDRDPHSERATACRARHLDQRCPGFSGGGSELAPVDLVESSASPPKACKQESRTQGHRTSCPEPDRADRQDRCRKRQSKSWGADGKR